MTAIQKFVLFLNQYANLLLVLITTIYVWLTWRNLRALQQASLREREARHLQEIKENVIQPIVSWIRVTLFGRFTGKFPSLLGTDGGYGGISRQVSHTLDDPFVVRRRLATSADDPNRPDMLATWSSLEQGRVQKFLYEHTKRDHYSKELRESDRLLEEVRHLTSAITSFANQCAKDMAGREVREALSCEDENSMSEWANSHLLVAECINAFLLGKKSPEVKLQSFQDFHMLMTMQNQSVAKSPQRDKLEHWFRLVSEQVRNRWEGSPLPGRVANLLEDANGVVANIERLLFHHSLRVDCELVSGNKPHRWS